MDNIEIENKAKEIRKDIIEQVYRASSGHPGGSLSIVSLKFNVPQSLPATGIEFPKLVHISLCSFLIYIVLNDLKYR